MGSVGGKLNLPVEGRLKLVKAGIQNPGKLTQLAVCIRQVYAFGEITTRNFAGTGSNLFDWADGTRRQPPTARQSKDHDHTTERKNAEGKMMQTGQISRDGSPHQQLGAV